MNMSVNEAARNDTYITTTELMGKLRKSRKTILDWIKRGNLPAIRVPGGFLFREADIDAWLASRTTGRAA